jgi:MFS transporter, MHS family, proline/betaine transporter
VIEAFRTEWRTILRVSGVLALHAVGFYLVFVYVVTYFQRIVHLSATEALVINSINMVVLLMLILASGTLSDRLGRKPVLLSASMGMLLLSWPLFWLLDHPSFLMALLGQMGFAVLVGLYIGAGSAAMVEAFPARVRCSAVSFSYNLCFALLGGTAPMVTAYLIARSQYDLSPSFYLMAAAAVSFAAVLGLRESARAPLE